MSRRTQSAGLFAAPTICLFHNVYMILVTALFFKNIDEKYRDGIHLIAMDLNFVLNAIYSIGISNSFAMSLLFYTPVFTVSAIIQSWLAIRASEQPDELFDAQMLISFVRILIISTVCLLTAYGFSLH